MAELIAKGPLAGLLPLTIGGLEMASVDPGPMFSLQPYAGKAAALSKALKKAHGVGFPGSGQSLSANGVRVLWSGRDQAFLLGVPVDPELGAPIARSLSQGTLVMIRDGVEEIVVSGDGSGERG